MKKLAALALLAVFLFNSVGYLLTFSILRFQVRQEVKTRLKQSLPEEELTVITFTYNSIPDINWEKEGKGFFHSGKLFDVVKKVEHLNGVTYYCISDDAETQLFTDLEEHIDLFIKNDPRSGDDHTGRKSSSKKMTHQDKLFFANDFLFSHNGIESELFFLHFNPNYISELSEIKSPPPESV